MTLKEKRAAAIKAAQTIIATAQAEKRDLTDDERGTLQAKQAEVTDLNEKIERAEKDAELLKQFASLGPTREYFESGNSLFDVKQAEGFAQAIRTKTNFRTVTSLTTAHLKAPMASPNIAPVMTGDPMNDFVLAPESRAALALRELMLPLTAEGPTIRYYKLGNPVDNAVDIVPELGLKPEAEISYTPIDKAMVKLATRFTISDELANDIPFLVSEMVRAVTRAIMVRENKLIIDTLGSTSGIIVATGTKAGLLDLLAEKIGASEAANGFAPSAVVLNPVDLAALRVAKASTGGSYFIDPLTAGPTMVFGVPVRATSAIPPGAGYLLSEGFGTFYTMRGAPLTVEAGHSGDDFIYNRVTIRAEERVLPAVIRPTLVTKLTITG